MTALCALVLLLAQAVSPGLDQLRNDPNPEHRAKAAVDFAAHSERNAEAAYGKDDMAGVAVELKNMQACIEMAQAALDQTGKSPLRHPGPFKAAELRTQEILIRLGDLERKMDADERGVVEGPRAKVQEIHDAWFDGIMSKKKR